MYKTANQMSMAMVTYYELLDGGAGRIPCSVAWIAKRFDISTYRAKNIRDLMYIIDAVYKDAQNGRFYISHGGFFVDCIILTARALSDESKLNLQD